MAKTYNPKRVAVSFAGRVLTGFADGTFISVERNEDTFTLAVGSDGEAARAASNNRSGRVTLTLMQTSASNDILSALAEADERSQLSTGPMMIKDASGRTVVLAAEAWIVKPAGAEFGREIGNREWIFETGDLSIFSGGN